MAQWIPTHPDTLLLSIIPVFPPFSLPPGWSWQSVDQVQDFPEQIAGYGDFSHLERHVAAMSGTLAPIVTSFSLMMVSDQCSTCFGNARIA